MKPELELYYLALTVLMTALLWMPYVLNRMAIGGIIKAIFNDPCSTDTQQSPWANRAKAAHVVAIENLPIFGLLILTTVGIGITTPITEIASKIYFWAFLIHYIAFTLSIPGVRTSAFMIAFAAELMLAYNILKIIFLS